MNTEKRFYPVSWATIQIDKITWFLVASCVLPFLFHLIPWSFSVPIGAVWLPMFYAPCAAALLYRPHVGILVSLLAPWLNSLILGRPESHLIVSLTADLFVFTLLIWKISRWFGSAAVLIAFLTAKLASELLFGDIGVLWMKRLAFSLPGMLMLFVISLFCTYFKKEIDQ